MKLYEEMMDTVVNERGEKMTKGFFTERMFSIYARHAREMAMGKSAGKTVLMTDRLEKIMLTAEPERLFKAGMVSKSGWFYEYLESEWRSPSDL